MSKSHSFAAAVAAVALMGLAATASAAPGGALTGAGEALKSEAQVGGAETVGYTCWWSHHRGRVCAWTRPQVYGFYHGPRRWHGGGRGWGYRRHW